VLAATCFVVGSNPLSSWLVLSLVDGGVSRGAAGLVSAVGTGTGAVVLVLAARRADRAGSGHRAAVAAGVAALTLTGTMALWAGTHLSLVLVAAGAVLGLLTAMVGAGFAHAVTVDRAPHAVGRATALMSGGYYLGALVSPLSFGALADHTGAYDASWAVTASAMALCVVSYLAVQRWVRPPGEPPAPPPAPTPAELMENLGDR
jgi:CP family cyanate transporter-like MFS transporter